jgi:hypothetical protein
MEALVGSGSLALIFPLFASIQRNPTSLRPLAMYRFPSTHTEPPEVLANGSVQVFVALSLDELIFSMDDA